MTEPIFLASLMALLYFTVRFRQTQSLPAALAAGGAALAGTLTRYEGWFLVPFVTVYFLVVAKRRTLLTAAVFTIAATQGWRFLSELFRADIRGNAEKISAYQVMALLMIVYVVVVAVLFPVPNPIPLDLRTGIRGLWNPIALLSVQLLWLVIFLHTGRSKVTGATLSFHVHRDRI